MKYGIDFRFLPKGATALQDNKLQVDVEVDETQFALIPGVGDFVDYPAPDNDIRDMDIKGVVRSRCFRYVLGYCYVTVVIEETTETWSKVASR